MAASARHLAIMGLALLALLPLPSNAEFLNDDLVFEESVNPPRWRTSRHSKLVDSEHTSDSDSEGRDSGLWAGAARVIHRIKRSWWSGWGSEESTEASTATTVTEDGETTRQHTGSPDSGEQKSTTLTRETRSPEDDEVPIDDTGYGDRDLELRQDDDEDGIGGTSGDSSGESHTTPDNVDFSRESLIPHSTRGPSSNNRVYYRVTLEINQPYHEALSNTKSKEFAELSEGFSRAVDELLQDVPGIHKSGVVNVERTNDVFFSKVTLDISSEGNNDADNIRRVLEESIVHRRSIGAYTLNPNFDFREFLAPGPYTPPTDEYCPDGDIQCRTVLDENCLPITARCNGTVECLDESDERGCPTYTETTTTTSTTTTPPTTPKVTEEPRVYATRSSLNVTRCRADDSVRCSDGSTVICVDQKCDGTPDCPDGDDEIDCPPEYECVRDEYMCDVSRCIPISQKCDGVEQCEDRTDEQDCPSGDALPVTTLRDTTPQRTMGMPRGLLVVAMATASCLVTIASAGDALPVTTLRDTTPQRTMGMPRGLLVVAMATASCLLTIVSAGDALPVTTLRDTTPQRTMGMPRGLLVVAMATASCLVTIVSAGDALPVTTLRDTSTQRTMGMSRGLLVVAMATASCLLTIVSAVTACSPDQFECRDGSGCVDRAGYCDGRPDCRDNSDEEGCDHNPRPACNSQREFECGDGTCIDIRLKCNGRVDCPRDGSDEQGCTPHGSCTASQFQCKDGTCIDFIRLCDFKLDCPDRSDEKDCKCNPTEHFMCGTGVCIPKHWVCDGTRNCQDGSDEKNCTITCRADQFRCKNGVGCVDQHLRCNKIPDCGDGSDEEICETCLPDQFRCNDGQCLPMSSRCNRHIECRDGEDEDKCPYISGCQPYEFQCRGDRSCISLSKKCNSIPDCMDWSDEEDCESEVAPCPSTDFTCKDGSCISKDKHCDGRPDCPGAVDEMDCSDGNPVHCMANEFRCNDGNCIRGAYQCDNVTDCSDGSDELNCRRPQPCSSGQITCGDGTCVMQELQCDGTYDCPGGEDERNCPLRCRDDEFMCDSRCVPNYKRCDRQYDCSDRSDETNCACGSNEFRCTDGTCIPSQRRCDGRSTDCRDGSDEINCPVPETTRPPVPPQPGDLGPVSCNFGQFACHSGTQCVPQSAHCDNNYDCRDFSDESNCLDGNPEGLNLKTYPTDQIIKESREVVFQCRDEGPLRASVRWTRGDGYTLPPGSRDIKGRLEMPNIQVEHTGSYFCEAVGFLPTTPGSRSSVYLKVEPFEQPSSPARKVCGFNEATCSNGECISKNQVCDGHYDCTDGSDEMRCNPHGCEPNEFRCDNKKCVQKTWRCDSDDDCGDGSDERNCEASPPGSRCRYNEYKCATVEQCIPKAFHCDMEVDCQDGSDEFGCSKAEIQKPPPSMVVKQPGETFVITCTAVGVPTPEVVWRLNWAHIPPKCQTTSVNGYGTLTCPNILESDQGAYSCEALNNRGSTFAIPDTILVVKSNNRTVCSGGSFNELATRPEDCIQCFCFGVSTSCRSADLFIYQLPPPLDSYRIVNVYITPNGAIEIQRGESQYQTSVHTVGRSGFQISLTDNELKNTYYSPVHPYFALPEHYYGNQLKTYGGYIKYTVKTDGTGSPLTDLPDVILSGNGYLLVYKGVPINPRVDNNIAVRFFPGNWNRVSQESGLEYPASRQDLMMALQDINQLLIRTQYFPDGLETTITDINMDSASFRNNGQGQAAYVEQCDCPHGYSGLSCETCAGGFMHQPRGPWLGTCEGPVDCPPKFYKDPRDNNQCKSCPCPHTDSHQFGTSCQLGPDLNITCVCPAGYEGRRCEKCSEPHYIGNPLQGQPCVPRPIQPECDPAGSKYEYPDPATGQCVCKDYATGRTCNQCKPNTFNLASGNQFGCISCFCMGINTTCTSSDLYRTQIVAAFTRNNQDFKLAEANRLNEPITDIQVNPSAQEIYFNQFNPGIYYWVLPPKFLYNQVTSYGGFLRYTYRYIPTPAGHNSRNSAPDVEIVSDSGVRLVYYNRNQTQPEANRPVTVVVPLLEQYWERVDSAPANREQLLMGLAELSNILIKATYTTQTQEAALLSVSLDTATADRNTGQPRAVEVEMCNCPVAYRGPSCEECNAGYTRIEEGLYLGTCEPCNCNGYSTQCDPDTGACQNCRGNTQGPKCDQCVEGYRGSPGSGVPCTPDSQGCSCDPRGSLYPSCDSRRQCTCKTNVNGESCSECRRGTFDLSEENIDGCLECYCSGVTNECQSSNLFREAIPMQIIDHTHKFSLTDASRRELIQDGFLLNPSMNEIGYDFANNQRSQRLFWSLPPDFTGNKVLSYGGNLNFTQRYSALPGHQPSPDTDVIIVSPTISVYWRTDEEELSPDVTRSTSIPLKENKWRRLVPSEGQRVASRAELMKVLSNIQAILIRATHSLHTQVSYLSDVSLDTAVSQRTGNAVASAVEVCRCPPGYRGSSCELCASGFYQDYDGTCKKCPCHGNEEHCALGPQQQVICTCKPSYAGTYCDKTIGPESPRPTPTQPTISISITDPTIIVIEAGNEVKFRCTGRSLVSSNPVELSWNKENGYLPQGRSYDDRRGLLVIKNVQPTDSGTYICTASDGYSYVNEKALLTVGGLSVSPPVVTVTPRVLNVREGEPVEFRCEASGVPTPTLQWVGERSSRMPPQSSFASGRFNIPYASLQDQGQYTCTASNSAGDDSETVALYVSSAPVTSPPEPVVAITIQPPEYRGTMGDTVRLNCQASSPRNIRLQWARQDGVLSPNARDSDGIFTIYDAQPSDSGTYICTAVDRNSGVTQREVWARVSISPAQKPQPSISMEPPKQTVSQGQTAELRCITNDGPQVEWSKAGDTLPPNAKINGNILLIERVEVRDRGVYVCQVEGPGGLSRVTGIIEVERREVPAIELFPRGSQTVIEGGSALFQCRILQGIPEPTLHWSRVDGTPLSRQVEQLPGGVLRFNSASRADEGQYLCTADNTEGSATTVAVLEVHSMPLITITPPGQSIKVSPNQRVRLDCRAYGHPQPTVVWAKHQPGYSFYEPKSVTPESPQGAVYEIKGATREDEGSYTCTARNAAGEMQERIQLIVSEEQTTSGPNRGDIPSTGSGVYIPDDDFTVPLGGVVTIRCIAQGPQQIFLNWVRRDERPLDPRVQVRNGELYISEAQYSDSGDYSCQGVGSRGEVLFTAVAHLRVIEPMQIKLDPERQVVRPGDTARINCSVTGEQPIDISWQTANNQPLPPSVHVSRGLIEFIGIRESDAGRYVCRASNIRGILEATADVIVNANPRGTNGFVRAVDRNPVAMEGTSIQLRCDVPDFQEISWSREARPLPPRASIQGSVLRIDSVQVEDSGRYICRANAYGSNVQDYIDLRVEMNPCTLDEFACRSRQCIPLLWVCDGIPQCSDGSDEASCQIRPGRDINAIDLDIQPSKREVHYGDTVELMCHASGPANTSPRMYWSRSEGGDLPYNSRQMGKVLRISDATQENSGMYKCTAILNNNRYDKEYYLSVHDDRPMHNATAAETVTAEYGKTVSLKCNINLEGRITHTWTKHGGVLPANAQVSGPHLTISSITYKDAGLYICTASNGDVQADIPKMILVTGAVPFFNQAPASYLALPTLSNGYLSFNIEITFKPQNPNGLILYNGQNYGGTGDFISFGLRDGIPEFRFDVGSGVGIVSGTQPLALGEWHTVNLNRVKKDGTMYVDDNQYYSGNSSGRMQGLDLRQPLYLGGVPDFSAIHKQNGFNTGFVGCISRLVINNKEEIDIIKENKESEGLTSCETCAVNPCINSGVCQEAPTKTGYTCLCPRGFSGLNCSHVGEPCYPGACGSGRCIDTDNGLECYCGLGRGGHRCEQEVPITNPSFNENSYMAYATPKKLNKIKIALKFNPADYSNGLLLYCAENEDGTGDFISLTIRDRYLEFKFDAGSGLDSLRSPYEVTPGQWTSVTADLGGREARLTVAGELPVSKSVRSDVYKFTTPMYVGGVDKQRIRLAAGVGVRQGFRGCVSEVQVSGLNLDLIRSVVDSANIAECSSGLGDPCQQQPCLNNGVCYPSPDGRTYQCSCPSEFSGQNCEVEQDMCTVLQPCKNGGTCKGTSSSFKCDCPFGFAGPHCDQRVQIRTEVNFTGEGYIELPKTLLSHTNPDEKEEIKFEFSTTQPNGLILWHGQTPEEDGTGLDFFSIAVVNGHLEFSYELGSSPAQIRSNERVDDGQRHRVEIKRQGKDGILKLIDIGSEEFGESGGLLTTLNAGGNIYVGGLPNFDHMTGSNTLVGFNGCIYSLQIQNSGIINFAEQALNSVNALPCSSSTIYNDYGDDNDEDRGPTRGDTRN